MSNPVYKENKKQDLSLKILLYIMIGIFMIFFIFFPYYSRVKFFLSTIAYSCYIVISILDNLYLKTFRRNAIVNLIGFLLMILFLLAPSMEYFLFKRYYVVFVFLAFCFLLSIYLKYRNFRKKWERYKKELIRCGRFDFNKGIVDPSRIVRQGNLSSFQQIINRLSPYILGVGAALGVQVGKLLSDNALENLVAFIFFILGNIFTLIFISPAYILKKVIDWEKDTGRKMLIGKKFDILILE